MVWLQRHVWVPFGIALVLGLAVPRLGVSMQLVLVPLVMGALFLACLKLDFTELMPHLKDVRFVGAVLIVLMLAVPIVLYWLASFVNDELAQAVLLLSAMPPGAAAPAITDALGGRVSLSFVLTVIGTVISPLTLLLLVSSLTESAIRLDLGELIVSLLIINLVPLLVAQLLRYRMRRLADKMISASGGIGVLLISGVIYIAAAGAAGTIPNDPLASVGTVGLLFLMFIFLQAVGYLLGFSRGKEDRIALSVSSTYMNNALAIGLAASWFGPQVALITVLSEVPWSTTIGPLQAVVRRLP